jgi:putative membrane protein
MPLSFPVARGLLLAMHVAGVIGLLHPFTHDLFLALVPFNLLVTAGLLFMFHRDLGRPFLVFCLLTYAAGFLVEVAGVHTGLIFGSYAYGAALGFKVWQVPLLIGVNWLVLVYSTGVVTHRLIPGRWLPPLVGAAVLVLLDVFIEPVAIRYGFWGWHTADIPLRNYVGWYVTALVLLTLFAALPFRKANPLAPWVLGVQFLFFCGTALLERLNFF